MRQNRPATARTARSTGIALAAACVMVLSVSAATQAGTSTGSSRPDDLTAMGGSLYFSAKDGTGDRELWVSDGTPGGTHRVKDINPTLSSAPRELTVVAGTLYFTANDGTGQGLWKSDGSASGTELVATIPDAYIYNLHAFGDTLIFVASDIDGHHLWKSDGTETGTELVASNPAAYPYIEQLETVGDKLFFTVSDGGSDGQLRKSDGTPEGTRFVKALPGSPYNPMTAVGTRLFFLKQVGTTGHFPTPYALWKSNGSTDGTKLVRDLVAGEWDYAYDVIDANGTAFLHAANGLWKSDGTFGGTVRLQDVDVSYFHQKAYVGGDVYFTVITEGPSSDLWKSDGTVAGTEFVSDAAPYRCLTDPFEPCDIYQPWQEAGVGGIYYFASDAGTRGIELWRSDGTAAGTRRVKDIRSGAPSSAPSDLTRAGGLLYFVANDGAHGRELWVSDGTRPGTMMVLDIDDT